MTISCVHDCIGIVCRPLRLYLIYIMMPRYSDYFFFKLKYLTFVNTPLLTNEKTSLGKMNRLLDCM